LKDSLLFQKVHYLCVNKAGAQPGKGRENQMKKAEILESFEIGTKVKVQTPAGIVEGEICFYHRVNAKTGVGQIQQFNVRFNYEGSGRCAIQVPFSKKTGLPYGWKWATQQGFKIVK
jgi:hypothetical protein